MTNDRLRSAPAAVSDGVEPGAVIGSYRIAGVLATGPSGTVFEAQHIASGRPIALRRLAPSFVDDPDALNAVIDASEISGKLSHRHIIVAEGVERHGGESYLVMEFGGSRTAASDGRMPWRMAARLIRDAARGLAAAHNAGLTHRNLKPAHLLIGNDGTVKIADFGLSPPHAPPAGPADFRAPEQLRGEAGNERSDIYSLGATFYYLLTGRPPFIGRTAADVIDGHLQQSVPTARAGAAEMPLRCDSIIHRSMSKVPADRFPSADAMIGELDALLETQDSPFAIKMPKLHSPRRLAMNQLPAWFGVAICLSGLALGAWQVFSRKGDSGQSASSKPGLSKPQASKVINSIGMSLVPVPPGRFLMGDPLIPDAKPHLVQITKPYLIGVHEVTQAQYQQVVGNNPSEIPGDRRTADDRPVANVTWAEAVAFCEKLSARPQEKAAGRSYRLPTEAEWEYACRAGTRSPFWLGETLSPTQANTQASGILATTPVGTYDANPIGMYDVIGNVWEWCYDWYGADYYLASPVDNPQGPTTGTRRVIRGGAFDTPVEDCRSAFRNEASAPDPALPPEEAKRMPPPHRGPNLGFRVVCVQESKN